MRILFIGEYSRLHNSLKEGLVKLGHEVTLVANGDGFKSFPSDYSIEPVYSKSPIGQLVRKSIFKVFSFDIAAIEQGFRFQFILRKLKNYEVVQLINERPIQTISVWERYLLGRIFKQNQKTFLLSCGVDYLSVQYLLNTKMEANILNPLWENPKLKKEYGYVLEYISKSHQNLHNIVFQHIKGVIATDLDYFYPLQQHPKFLGLIPNPVNTDKLKKFPNQKARTVIFLGVNKWNQYQKGISYFKSAIEIVQKKYPNLVEIIVAENMPYAQYLIAYERAHILLDQVFAMDQGYNALEAMAQGKVVFTGAGSAFVNHYKLSKRVTVAARPDVEYLANALSELIENPQLIAEIGESAREFIEQEHHYVQVAARYIEKWSH